MNLPGGLDGNYTLAFVDTTTIHTSTVLVDSLPTSGKGTVLLGRYVDDKLGVIEANPYVQFSLNTTIPSDNAVYDSIGLIMHCSGYSYGDASGDTYIPQTVEVRRVTEFMQYHKLPEFWKSVGEYSYFNLVTDGYGTEVGEIPNIKKIGFDESAVLGSATVNLKSSTLSTDSIYVRLSDDLGNDFFEKMKSRPREFRLNTQVGDPNFSDYYYANYFKGLRLHTLNESSIVGITLSTVKLRIYYTQIVAGDTKHYHYDFTINTSRPNYTNITADRSSTSVATLTAKNELSSKVTNNETYMQSGTGLVTKITLPHLDAIGNAPGFTQISSAVLILEPVKNSYTDTQYLPQQLTLNYTDKSNHVVTPLAVANLSSSVQYAFSITSLVQSIAVSGGLPKELSFIVSTSSNASTNNNFTTTTTRLCVGDGSSNYRARVEIYYLKEKM
ncbi:MAG TPA: DUF4270 family protein [Cyclobacteriaceae bacterium]